jgi:hypothetical protein
LKIYKSLYEEALTKLKSDTKPSNHNFKSSSRLKYDERMLVGSFNKAKAFIAHQDNELNLQSIDEAYLVCESIKQLYMKEKGELYETFTKINDKIKELEELYTKLQEVGENSDQENVDNNDRKLAEENENIKEKVDDLDLNKNKSHQESRQKFTEDTFSIIRPTKKSETNIQKSTLSTKFGIASTGVDNDTQKLAKQEFYKDVFNKNNKTPEHSKKSVLADFKGEELKNYILKGEKSLEREKVPLSQKINFDFYTPKPQDLVSNASNFSSSDYGRSKPLSPARPINFENFKDKLEDLRKVTIGSNHPVKRDMRTNGRAPF